jgi:RNA polymerase II elongation factor ELL
MEQKFSFSLTENEETQGSFECLQQTNSGQINVLGPVHQKMRVQAQEDVYENTKRSMAKAALIQKEKR